MARPSKDSLLLSHLYLPFEGKSEDCQYKFGRDMFGEKYTYLDHRSSILFYECKVKLHMNGTFYLAIFLRSFDVVYCLLGNLIYIYTIIYVIIYKIYLSTLQVK